MVKYSRRAVEFSGLRDIVVRRVPIVTLDSGKRGPTVCITGCIHGNEPGGMDPENEAGAKSYDTKSIPGADLLCATWRDPDWDAQRSAVYYARVVENPSCRYDAWQCLALPEAERAAECADPRRAKTIQERAWSSPIWYER